MSVDEQFNKAVEDVRTLKAKPSDNDLLEIYALFKQATVGDATDATKPGMLDFKGKAKWEAWKGKQGTSSADSKAAYVKKVNELLSTLGTQ